MSGLSVLLRKELLESWRTMRLPIVGGLFLLVGLTSPLLARFLPDIIKAAAGDQLRTIPLPTPVAADAVDQLWKNLAQFGAFAAIVLAMGSVATERDRGTAAFVLSKTVTRGAFLGAKVVGLGAVLAVCVALAVAVGWLYTAILFEPQPVGGWVAFGVLAWLGLAAWAAITFLAQTVTGSTAAAAGVGFVALLDPLDRGGHPERGPVPAGRARGTGHRVGRGRAGRRGRCRQPGRLDGRVDRPRAGRGGLVVPAPGDLSPAGPRRPRAPGTLRSRSPSYPSSREDRVGVLARAVGGGVRMEAGVSDNRTGCRPGG